MIKQFIVVLLLNVGSLIFAMENSQSQVSFSDENYKMFCHIKKVTDIVWQVIQEEQKIKNNFYVIDPREGCCKQWVYPYYPTQQGLCLVYRKNCPSFLLSQWGTVKLTNGVLGNPNWKNINEALDKRITKLECMFSNEDVQKIGEIYAISAIDGEELPVVQEETDTQRLLRDKQAIDTIWHEMTEKYLVETQVTPHDFYFIR